MATSDTTRTQRRARRHSRRAPSVVALLSVAALALAAAGNAFADGSDALSAPSAELPEVAASAADAAPAAGPAAPDTVSGAQPAANGESSTQPPSSGDLEAATQQAATADANATQNNVQNIVIIIRINSPGDDVISQSNTANAGAVGTNTATTQQGTPNGQRDATAAPERARPRVPAAARPSGDHAGGASGGAAGTANSFAAHVRTSAKPGQNATRPEVAPRQAATAAPRPVASTASARHSRPSGTPVSARMGRAATRAGAGVAHFVGSLPPTPTSTLSGDKADQVSTVVVMTLLVIGLAVLLGAGSTYLPSLRARAWR